MFSLHPSLYFFLKSFFHLFLMFTLVPDENSMEDPLCNSSFASMVSLDYVTPDTVKDDSGAYEVFTEQGSSASQMTAEKVMNVTARFPDFDGHAADAVSACTQAKLKNAPRWLKIPKTECPDVWIRLPRHKWPKSWRDIEDLVELLERHLYGHPLARLLWRRQF